MVCAVCFTQLTTRKVLLLKSVIKVWIPFPSNNYIKKERNKGVSRSSMECGNLTKEKLLDSQTDVLKSPGLNGDLL